MATATSSPPCREELTKSEQEFVTVVSVGSQPATVENFVTVLSIGTEDKNDCQAVHERTSIASPLDIHPEEQVEVFRLPGEPLGFGLKFEGGAKNAERVKRLFVQSCAEQSPASRAKCSWGTIGEGDEVLSIDGVPVTHMSRLDCVRRLKESQLVIKLLIRCRGALRPEVVSAERKSPPDIVTKTDKVPPELPSVPPPVPPRKLRQARGSADGEANPIPAKKTWNGSPKSNSGSSSQTDSPQSQNILHGASGASSGKSVPQEPSNSAGNSSNGSPNASPKRSSNEASPEMAKSKQEPPEAMVYLDARSQDGSSTHGSTSDDTGSSMSTVVDRFSMSDRFSTVSTASTTSGGASDQQGALDRSGEEHTEENRDFRDSTRLPPFEQLEQDFLNNSSDYLLKRLANSEAVTHVESRGEAGGIVEKITAVVAPNTVLIEETLTLQPPLSFQDAPLSYGHETRPDLVYTADLAGDSTTHFRPIRDEASIVECVNGENLQNSAPSLPARNHVNRIPVNQQKTVAEMHNIVQPACQALPKPRESLEIAAPILPPKPMPRKDVKSKRKRPPPPPPPPRRDPPPPVPLRGQVEASARVPGDDVVIVEVSNIELKNPGAPEDSKASSNDARLLEQSNGNLSVSLGNDQLNVCDNKATLSAGDNQQEFLPEDSPIRTTDYSTGKTNKVLEIIEMKKVKAFGECTPNRSPAKTTSETAENEMSPLISPAGRNAEVVPTPREKKKLPEMKRESTASTEIDDSETPTGSISENWQDAKERQDSSEYCTMSNNSRLTASDGPAGEELPLEKDVDQPKNNVTDNDDDDDETYRSLDEIKEDFKSSETNATLSSSEDDEEDATGAAQREGDSTSEDSEDNGDDDYYWQSNLATIGEEEETSSLEYTIVNKDVNDSEDKSPIGKDEGKAELRGSTIEKNETMKNATTTDVTKPECVKRLSKDPVNALDKKLGTQVNAGRMENCGGDQRLPPDGDEFPATYQEFSGCTSEQYQYVTSSTRTTQRKSGATSNGSGDCNDIDETTTSVSSTSSSFVEKARNESLKLARNDSIIGKNQTSSGTNTSAAREKSSTYVRSTSVQQPVVESRVSSQYITSSSLKRETILPLEVTARSTALVEDTSEKRTSNSYFTRSSPRVSKPSNNAEPVLVVSEKTFEISGFYPKETKVTSEIIVPDFPESPPPPLPLTGPPKVPENVAVPISKNVATPAESSPQRKFSLNGDLWRQDDKSEKSVRDKIAMFSSQSSLETPLFPSQASPGTAGTSNVSTNARRLSKYKSSEDVFCDEKIQETKELLTTIERTRSSVDLTDSRKISGQNETMIGGEKYDALRAPSLPKSLPPEEPAVMRVTSYSAKALTAPPAVYQKPAHSIPEKSVITSREFASSEFNNTPGKNIQAKPIVPPRNSNNTSLAFPLKSASDKDPLDATQNSARSNLPSLARATSFSGESSYSSDLSQLANPTIANPNGQISRTNSLASTFRRNSEDMRRQSLNQLIEQRRKGITKLRGLVIPEKNAVPIDKPIIDLPEIKSRDSILLHQVPKANIQDKWGSQSSIASNTSSASSPMKATTSFKMPAPQIMSKYSPAFKRKSLAVYGSSSANSSAANTPPSTRRPSPTNNHSGAVPDPPKSLESICSPTRSDYSFEFVTSTSVSPDTGMRNRARPGQRKIRGDYDDSDNDSAVSSSQSSISRGFSPPTSPAPSERSSISSERSYHTSLIMEMPSRNYSSKESANRSEKSQYIASAGMYSENRAYPSSERSSSGSSSGSSPNPRSPQPDANPRSSHIPQRQALKRSSSTETNCSSGSSSTLTSGSQASAESLSRRVLKPQSVEAINRKNILASARCRSGRDLNGSPLIQRKFSDDEELPVSGLAQENGNCSRARQPNGSAINDSQDVKIAYIEVTEIITEDEDSRTRAQSHVEESKETISNASSAEKSNDSDLLETSNDLKMWVRSEAKALMADMPRQRLSQTSKQAPLPSEVNEPTSPLRAATRSRTSLTLDDPRYPTILDTWSKPNVIETTGQSSETRKLKSASRGSINDEESISDSVSDELLTTLTTKTRSRAPINLEDRSFSRSSRQMSLEDILVGKAEPKLVRAQSVTDDRGIEKNTSLQYSGLQTSKLPASRNNSGRMSLKESWSEDRSFVSKIPTLGRPNKGATDVLDDSARLGDRSRTSKIPTQRPLDRRSASVTDMKKALEKTDSGSSFNITSTSNNQSPTASGVHHRFPSLDSSVEERTRLVGHEPETDRFNGEQFGSISSLASSTSLISQQELAQLVEEASSLEDARGAHDVVVVLLHKENPHGSVGITLAGGVDCEAKEITVHRVLAHSVADKDGRVQRGDRILSINGRSTRGLNHRESLAVLKQPRSEVVLVVSRSRLEEGSRLRSRTDSVETIVEGPEACGTFDDTAWGPATRVAIFKDGAGLGFSLAGGRDSPLGDRPLVIKKIFTGGAAEKTAALTAGDQLLEVNGIDVTRMSRIEAWSLMKKLSDGEANLLVRHPATKSS